MSMLKVYRKLTRRCYSPTDKIEQMSKIGRMFSSFTVSTINCLVEELLLFWQLDIVIKITLYNYRIYLIYIFKNYTSVLCSHLTQISKTASDLEKMSYKKRFDNNWKAKIQHLKEVSQID